MISFFTENQNYSLKKTMIITMAIVLFCWVGWVEAKPERIVSMNLCTDQLILRLAEPERIAALTKYMDDPENATLLEQARPFKKIRGTAEEVLSFKPDLVVAGRFTSPMTVSLLKQLGLRVEVFDVPSSYEEIRILIRRASAILEERARGETMIAEMESRLKKLPKPKAKFLALFYGVGGSSAGKGTFEDAILMAAGGENLAAHAGIQGHRIMPLEEIVMGKPNLLIFSDEAVHRGSVRRQVFAHPVIRRYEDEGKTMRIPNNLLVCGSLDTLDAAAQIASHMKAREQSLL